MTGKRMWIIAAVALVALAGGGWYAYRTMHKKTVPGQTTPPAAPQPAADPTAGWRTYNSASGKYTLRYPATWSLAEHPELCADGLLLMGPSEQSVGACASENAGEVSVMSIDGDFRADQALDKTYTDIHQTTVTVQGVAGTRYTGTEASTATTPEAAPGVLPSGTKTVRYVFYAAGKTYVATYSQQPVYPDALNQFELIITKTLQFSS